MSYLLWMFLNGNKQPVGIEKWLLSIVRLFDYLVFIFLIFFISSLVLWGCIASKVYIHGVYDRSKYGFELPYDRKDTSQGPRYDDVVKKQDYIREELTWFAGFAVTNERLNDYFNRAFIPDFWDELPVFFFRSLDETSLIDVSRDEYTTVIGKVTLNPTLFIKADADTINFSGGAYKLFSDTDGQLDNSLLFNYGNVYRTFYDGSNDGLLDEKSKEKGLGCMSTYSDSKRILLDFANYKGSNYPAGSKFVDIYNNAKQAREEYANSLDCWHSVLKDNGLGVFPPKRSVKLDLRIIDYYLKQAEIYMQNNPELADFIYPGFSNNHNKLYGEIEIRFIVEHFTNTHNIINFWEQKQTAAIYEPCIIDKNGIKMYDLNSCMGEEFGYPDNYASALYDIAINKEDF